jgi:hypothetical protein
MTSLKIFILGLAIASCSRSENELSDTAGFSEPSPSYELVYDVGLAEQLSKNAVSASQIPKTEPYNPCWKRVWQSLKWTFGNQIENTSVGSQYAYNFAEWANPSAQRLYDTFRLKKKSFAGAEIPVGSVVVWKPGSCGYSSRAGHIEVVVSPGRACSFYCGPICTSAVPEVYVPVKKQLRNEIINTGVATSDIPNQVWTPGMASTVPVLFTPGDRPIENRPPVVTSNRPPNTPTPQVVSPVPMPSQAPDSQCKYGRDSAGFCNISPDLNPFALAH